MSGALCQSTAKLQLVVNNCSSDVFVKAFKELFDCQAS